MAEFVSNYNKVPALKDAFKLLKNVSTAWDDIASELDISKNDRDGLRRDMSLTNEQRLETILHKWLQQGGKSSTWKQLMKALSENQDYTAIVEKIKRFLE